MDALIVHPKHLPKLITNTLNISIVMGLLLSQHIFEGPPIFAKELSVASNVIIAPLGEQLTNPVNNTLFGGITLEKNIKDKFFIEQETQKFNEEIRRKYKKGTIIDVDKGVKRIKLVKYYQGSPVRINVIEVKSNLNPSLELTPALASDTLGKKSSISTIAKKNNSIVAINGTFFKPSTGVPLGTLMINKKMYTGPIYNRVAMGIFDNGYDMARVQLNANLRTWNKSVKVDNLNQPRTLSTQVIVYTSDWGKTAPPSPKYGEQIAVNKDNKVIETSINSLTIPEGGFVVVGPAKNLDTLKDEKCINFEILTIPEWVGVKHIISGGPYLVKDSQVFVDVSEQKLGAIGGRNPRTAVGYTPEGNLIIVTVDGRESTSVGMTLTELANFMKSIGCCNAMNLDGGGSTVLYVNGQVVNHPQVQGGILLSNALTLNKIN